MDKQDKPLSEWTLKEVQEMCDNQDDCPGCPFYTAENGCMFSGEAACWPLDEAGAVITPISDDIDALIKPDKPRLAEVLGVDVGERFRIKGVDQEIIVDKNGKICTYEYEEPIDPIDPYEIFDAINHPERIIRAPRLTEAELERCRVYGAKWVSMDKAFERSAVKLWDVEPKRAETVCGHMFEPSVGDHALASVHTSLFPSVKPGDCIELEVRS